MNKWNRYTWFPVLIIMLVMMPGCDPAFEPLQENDRYFFSIYGYLDASADTNWIRITPVRDQLFPEPEAIDAIVTLENLESGEKEVMKDSVFHYEGIPALNFWTTMQLEPAQAYRITARNSLSDSSYVDVKLPRDFPTPLVVAPPDFFEAFSITIHIEGVEHLADVRTFHQIQRQSADRQQIVSFSHLADTSDAVMPTGEQRIWFQPPHILQELRNLITDPFHIIHQQLFIASGGPEWHYFPGIDEEMYALPDAVSNVENGVGYVAGIVSKTVPLATCYSEMNEHIPCPLEKPMRDP